MRVLNARATTPAVGWPLVLRRLLICPLVMLTVSCMRTGLADEDQRRGNRPTARPDKPEDPRYLEVEEFVRNYFGTWSNRDIEGYQACFLPAASIQFIDSRGELATYARAQFVASQRKHHRTARHRMTEVPESIDIRFESRLARAVVYWKLTAGPKTDFGYDHFTLVKHQGEWRIVNLVFYSTRS